jgi:hypothetical protein
VCVAEAGSVVGVGGFRVLCGVWRGFGCGGMCFGVDCGVYTCLMGFMASKQKVFRNPQGIKRLKRLER